MAITLDGTSGITTPGVVGNLSVSGNTTVGGTLTNTGLITASAGVAVGGTGSANTLDDYEEGTWTPLFKATSSNPTISYDTQLGFYTKIGNFVFLTFALEINTIILLVLVTFILTFHLLHQIMLIMQLVVGWLQECQTLKVYLVVEQI